MATAPTYCTHRQLKDVFPQLDSFDNKRPIYGWEAEATLADFGGASNVNVYYAYNVGLVTQLFKDGQLMTNLTSNVTTKKTEIGVEVNDGASAVGVDNTTGFEQHDLMKINNEWMKVSAVTDGTTLAVSSARNLFGTHQLTHAVDSGVYLAVDESTIDSVHQNWFFYDADLDLLVASFDGSVNPNDLNMEAGEDFSTLITRITANASRYLDAKLDPNLPKEQLKDKEGNYDYIIVRTTALLAATFLIRSHDPTSEVATAMMEDAMGNIDALNKGGAALSWQTTGDSSKGVIRDVTYTSGSIRPVDTRGRWSGSWDLIKIKVIDGGVLGTATYSVWVKDGESLKNRQVVTAEKITGDYQHIANGLEIRFGGANATASTGISATQATADDEWEVEVAGWREEVDNSSINSVKMTRGGTRTVRFGKY
jgi:hypothetical protein